MADKKAEALALKTMYTTKDIEYLKGTSIVEYDIGSAGFNVLKYKQLLTPEEINRISKLKKDHRNILLGKMSKYRPEFNKAIKTTLEEVRLKFIVDNEIPADNIISIKKDAIFLWNSKPKVTNIETYFDFRPKAEYSSMFITGKYEFYYSAADDKLDVKGISKDAHDCQLLEEIRKLLKLSERFSDDRLFNYIKDLREKYLYKELDLDCYRQINSGMFACNGFLLQGISNDLEDQIDITFNYMNVLLPLFKALLKYK